MSDTPETTQKHATSQARTKRLHRLALLLVAASAAILWLAGRMNFVTVEVQDDLAGNTTRHLNGSVWDPAATPLALAMLAATLLSFALQPLLRRVLGGVIVVLAGIASFRSVELLTVDIDLMRAQNLLTSGVATQNSQDPNQISQWAVVLSGQTHSLPLVLALLGAALGVVGGVVLLMRPGLPSAGHSRYETPEARRAGAQQDLEENPDSSRVLWDALDAGVDPTDEDRGRGEK